MSLPLTTHMTPEAYLIWERQQEMRHEYINGDIHAMVGASRAHNLICANVLAALHQQLRGQPCEVYANDMRVKINATGMYTYPDVVVVCSQPLFADDCVDTLLNPVLIIEILSPSTEKYDRGAKFLHYRRLASLQEYVLIAQHEYRIEHYQRHAAQQWLLTEYTGHDAVVELVAIPCVLCLDTVYERVPLAQ